MPDLKRIQELNRELELYRRGFVGDGELVTIPAGSITREIGCLQCPATTTITHAEPIAAPAGEIGKEIVDTLDQCQSETEWVDGLCPEHRHLNQP